jgi:hypothetical protein
MSGKKLLFQYDYPQYYLKKSTTETQRAQENSVHSSFLKFVLLGSRGTERTENFVRSVTPW